MQDQDLNFLLPLKTLVTLEPRFFSVCLVRCTSETEQTPGHDMIENQRPCNTQILTTFRFKGFVLAKLLWKGKYHNFFLWKLARPQAGKVIVLGATKSCLPWKP